MFNSISHVATFSATLSSNLAEYHSFYYFLFGSLLLSLWLLDYWVAVVSRQSKQNSCWVLPFVLGSAFLLFFMPALLPFIVLDFSTTTCLFGNTTVFSFFGSSDNLSILFIFMVHFVDFLTLVFLLLYYNPTTQQSAESMRVHVWAIFVMTALLDVLFLSTNFLVMFVAAEFSLFPLSFLLLKENTIFWRSVHTESEETAFENKRPLAFYYLALFTVISGGLGMIGLVILYLFFGDLSFIGFKNFFNFGQLDFFSVTVASEELLAIHLALFFILFWIVVKVPLAPVHVWLPKAHVEGSTESSMLLAGIVLKITTYILIRLSGSWFFAYFFFPFESFFLTMAVTTAIFGALGALSTVDLKRLAAYSSVSHMGIILVSGFLISFSSFALQPYVILLMTHTIISTSMFFIIGCIYKLRLKNIISRNRLTYSGLLFIYPYYFLIGLILFANLNIPLTLGFVGELGILVSAAQLGFSTLFFLLLGSFLLLVPILTIVAQVLMGPVKLTEFAVSDEGVLSSKSFLVHLGTRIYTEVDYGVNQRVFHDCIKFVLCAISILIVVFGLVPFVFARLSFGITVTDFSLFTFL